MQVAKAHHNLEQTLKTFVRAHTPLILKTPKHHIQKARLRRPNHLNAA